jgi:uncharacterized membrane protein YjdF
MSIPEILKICAVLYLAVILAGLFRSRRLKRFLLELLPLIGLLAIDVIMASTKAGYVTFGGGSSPTVVILIMFVCILFGIGARYIFYLEGKFSWLDFVKPLCISPILLLPLIASVQTAHNLEAIQIVSFALLAFQNGFFWQAVLTEARPKTLASTSTIP